MKLRLFSSSAPLEAGIAHAGLDLLATAVLMLDARRRVTYANPAAENLFELSRAKLVGNTTRELFGDAPDLAATIDKAVISGASYTEQELEGSLRRNGAETVLVLTPFYRRIKAVQPRTALTRVVATNVKE